MFKNFSPNSQKENMSQVDLNRCDICQEYVDERK